MPPPKTVLSTLRPTGLLRLGARAAPAEAVDWRRHVGIDLSVLGSLTPAVHVGGDAADLPVSTSRVGNLFDDGVASDLSWYLPEFRLVDDPDGDFGFAAVQAGSDEEGEPFNKGTLSLGLRTAVPADVVAAQSADPARRFQEIPLSGLSATVVLAATAEDGSAVHTRVAAQITLKEGGFVISAPGLLGPAVTLAWTALTQTGAVSLELGYSYQTVRWVDQTPDSGDGGRFVVLPEILRPFPVEPDPLEPHPDRRVTIPGIGERLVSQPAFDRQPIRLAADVQVRRMSGLRLAETVSTLVRPMRPIKVLADSEPIQESFRVAVREVSAGTVELPIGSKYAGPSYRPRYTLTVNGATRGLIGIDDLKSFEGEQSEYIELTVLGNVAARYPSLRSVYLGQVSGTVVAVPAVYGILRGAKGCFASLDALVDPSPQSSSGARFQVNVVLAPVVHAGDLARLAADLEAEPSLDGRSLHLTLPTDLDRNRASTLQSTVVSNAGYGVGQVPNTFRLSFDVVDDALPAVAKVNLVLNQLESDLVPSLVGRLFVRLDDAHPQEVSSEVVLSLRTTSTSDDVVVVLQAGRASVSNVSPHDVRLTRLTTHGPAGYTDTPSDQRLAAGSAAAIDVPEGTEEVLVDRTLDLPADVPAAEMDRYVAMEVVNVQSVRHVLGINAIGQLAGQNLTRIEISLSLTSAPDTILPVLTLTPERELEQATVQIPLASALRGLSAAVALTLHGPAGSEPRQRQLTHDFGTSPVLMLTAEQLAP